METQQLLKTRLELPFSPANGYMPKELRSHELQAFFLQRSELVISEILHLSEFSFIREGGGGGVGGEIHVKADDTLGGPRWRCLK